MRIFRLTWSGIAGLLALGALAGILFTLAVHPAHAHMHDRPDLNEWFENIHNDGGGLCCSMEEGVVIAAEDYRNTELDKCEATYQIEPSPPAYCVLWKGRWRQVYANAVITKPNPYGAALAWPVYEWAGDKDNTWFRCFIPGPGA
jgi:hypothetical protein